MYLNVRTIIVIVVFLFYIEVERVPFLKLIASGKKSFCPVIISDFVFDSVIP